MASIVMLFAGGGGELRGAGMDGKDCLQCPLSVQPAIVVCRQYAVSDTIAMRGVKAVHTHSCEHAA
jgi:hypothetical protein